jgi:DNA-binding transcriptional MerR regulator
MQSYQINELERLTGVKAHTIRIWEKRYELITPHRTTTNRRYYDDDQVRKLLNVSTLLSRGYKISKIAALTEVDINTHIQNKGQKETHDHRKRSCVNDMIKAMIAFDERTFENLLGGAVGEYGMQEAMLQVVYPFLQKTGILWNVNKAIPLQEHFASNIIRRKLLTAIDGLQVHDRKKKKFLLFLPPGEWHETGLILADFIIRSSGCNTIYLGQNVPCENVDNIAPALSPDYMLLFYIAARPKEQIEAQLKELSKNNPGTHILVSGNADLFTGIKSLGKNISYLPEVKSLLDFLK